MSDFVRPHRWQPTRLPCPWDSPGKNTEVGCHFLLQCMKVKSESEVAQSCRLLAIPWTAAYQAPPSMGFSKQESWSGVPLSSPLRALKLLNRSIMWHNSTSILNSQLLELEKMKDRPLKWIPFAQTTYFKCQGIKLQAAVFIKRKICLFKVIEMI